MESRDWRLEIRDWRLGKKRIRGLENWVGDEDPLRSQPMVDSDHQHFPLSKPC